MRTRRNQPAGSILNRRIIGLNQQGQRADGVISGLVLGGAGWCWVVLGGAGWCWVVLGGAGEDVPLVVDFGGGHDRQAAITGSS
jgi:hypothetical protein